MFTAQASDVDETPRPGEDPVALAIRLARLKAEVLPLSANTVVLGADTVVVAPSGELLGKPAGPGDAARMLELLAGATHRVITGVCVRSGHSAAPRIEVAAALTYVTVHTLSPSEIAAYIATGEPMGKAGGYAIQGRAARWIPHIHGDYSNVVGLPLALAANMLAAAGVLPA